MNNRESLLIDVITILPENADCYIQAPSLEDKIILSLMNKTELDYFSLIKLSASIKEEFIKRISNYPIEEYFQSVEIRLNNKLLFQAYDGVEFGILSNSIDMPKWFIEKYIETEICSISPEW